MQRRSVVRRRRLPSSLGLLAAAALGLASGCLVSFDGYQARGAAGSAGHDPAGGKPSANDESGGDPAATSGEGPGDDDGGGEGGRPDTGGSAGAGKTSGGAGAGGGSGGSSAASNGGSSGAASGAAGNSGNAGSGGQPPTTCPVNLEGPPMIEIPKPGGGFYCMDRTEVPAEDYAVFLAAKPSTGGQAATCAWNTTYEPDTSSACTSAAGAYNPAVRPRAPVSCVDWCDAKRYCEWAGKRLCGAIGGGANPTSQFADATASQWYRACTKAGTQKFPYGDAYQPTYCVGLDNSGVHPSAVATAVACEGGYPGLFDMSGNVAEWEDSCDAGGACLIRGGDILQAERTTPSLLCNSSKLDATAATPAKAPRDTRDELIGFRCCLDP